MFKFKFISTFGVLFSLLVGIVLQGRAQSLSVISATSCGLSVESPIYASQLIGAASISLKINYDTSLFQFDGIRNLHPGLSSALITANQGKFIVAWFSLNPVSMPSDTMLVIKWLALQQGVSTLAFDVQIPGNVEITNLQGQILGLQYNDGTITRMGALAPAPLTPLHHRFTNETELSIFYQDGQCIDAYVFQHARDTFFSQQRSSQSPIIHPHRFIFPMMQPNQGDSVLWWRIGGISGTDTLWSQPGRIAFELLSSLALLSDSRSLKQYPNPFDQTICIEAAETHDATPVLLELYAMTGQKLCEASLSFEGNSLCWRIETYVSVGTYLLILKILEEKRRFIVIKS